MSKVVILNIAGFFIKLLFTEVESDLRKTLLINLIKKQYKQFLPETSPSSVNYTISFNYGQKIRSLSSGNNTVFYINLYLVKSPDRLETYYHISLYQLDLVLTHVLQILLSNNNGFFIHTSAVLINNTAHLFLGKSGDGKSTSSQLLKKFYPVLSDDGAILRKEQGHWYLYQTPFPEKNKTMKKTGNKYPVGKLFFLKKASYFKITKLSGKSLLANKLLMQLYSQPDDINRQFHNLVEYVNTHDVFFNLYFKKEATGLKKILEKNL